VVEASCAFDAEFDIIIGPEITKTARPDASRILTRVFDDKALKLQRQGRLGTYAPTRGQEASQIGSAFAIQDEDMVFPAFRENSVFLVRRMPMELLFQFWGGDERGMNIPKNVNMFPIAITVGAQLLHAVGYSIAMKYKKKKAAAITYFGDGATSEGDFHEALNFAGVFNTPCVFICQNNQYAISVPVEEQTASETLAQKDFSLQKKAVRFAKIIDNLTGFVRSLEFEKTLKVKTYIGEENPYKYAKEFSTVVVCFPLGSQPCILGIVGPLRISYKNIIPLLTRFAKALSQNKLLKGPMESVYKDIYWSGE